MKLKILKFVFNLVASIVFFVFLILFAIQLTSTLKGTTVFNVFYFTFYCLCFMILTVNFIAKTIMIAKNDLHLLKSFQSRSTTRAEARAAKAEEKKQERIKALENELEELKKD